MLTHSFPFDPTGGYSPEQLRRPPPLPPAPSDLEAFWRATYETALAAPLDWHLRPSAQSFGDTHELLDLDYAGLLGNRVGGWFARPRGRPARRALLMTHGYGGRDAPELPAGCEDTAIIYPVCTGLPTRSLHPGIPATGDKHVLHGIATRETYVHRFCVMDVWRAASVLLAAAPDAGPQVDYIGQSFGGGIGALALPWEPRFRRAHLIVPSFGHHPLRLGLPCSGSGESVRLHAQTHPEVREVLSYFDAALAASHTRIPVFVAVALFDPAVPPAGQFAIAHALAGPKQIYELTAGHFDHRDTLREDAAVAAQARAFFV